MMRTTDGDLKQQHQNQISRMALANIFTHIEMHLAHILLIIYLSSLKMNERAAEDRSQIDDLNLWTILKLGGMFKENTPLNNINPLF